MDNYNKYLKEQFGQLVINLVSHDSSEYGMPCKIVVELGKMPKDKGETAKDLSNYLYRMGLRFQCVLEYQGRGKKLTLSFYMTWNDVAPIRANILKACNKSESMLRHATYLPFEFSSLIIQDVSRGVFPREAA